MFVYTKSDSTSILTSISSYFLISLTVESTNSGGSSSGGGGFAETDFSTASCASSIDAVGAAVVTGVGGGDHQLVRVCVLLYISSV